MILSRGCHKFPGDVELWLYYARECVKNGSKKLAGKVFGKALRFNGANEKLWLACLAFQYDVMDDVVNARALAQNAIRFVKDSVDLWVLYFELELRYLAKLVFERRELGMGIPEDIEFWKGGVPVMIFRKGCEELGRAFDERVCARFLGVCRDVLFGERRVWIEVEKAMKERFGGVVVGRVECIRGNLDKVLLEIRELEVLLKRVVKDKEEGEELEEKWTKEKAQAESKVKEIAKCVGDNLVEVLTDESDEEVCTSLRKYIEEERIMELVYKHLDEEEKTQVQENWLSASGKRASNALSLEDIAKIKTVDEWKRFLHNEQATESEFMKPIRKSITECCAVPLRNHEQEKIALEWMSWEEKCNGIQGVRDCYQLLLRLSQSSRIAFAAANAEAKFRKTGFAENVRKLFGQVEKDRGESDVEFWLRWWKFEQEEMRDGKRSGQVFWKATSKLKKKAQKFAELVEIRKVVLVQKQT